MREIGKYTDILSGEKDLPEVGKACTKDCSEDCNKHDLYCVYWITVTPSTPRISKLKYWWGSDVETRRVFNIYYPSGTTKNKFDIFTDGYIGITKNFKRRMKSHTTNTSIDSAPISALIRLHDKDIRFYVLSENLTKAQALNLEKFYRPNRRIGWNIAKGGGVKYEQSLKPKNKKVERTWVSDMTTGKSKLVPVKYIDTFLEDNLTWRMGMHLTHPMHIYKNKRCFPALQQRQGHYTTAEELKQYCIEQRKLNCTRPTACCLDYIPLDDLANGYIKSLQERRRHDSQEALTKAKKLLAKQNFKHNRVMQLNMGLYTLENGVERKIFTREEGAKFFNCSVSIFKKYVHAKHFVERDGKSYAAEYKEPLKQYYPLFKISNPIYDWKVVKIETKGQALARQNAGRPLLI